MAIQNYEEMSITSPAFNTVREAFDIALQRLLKKMEKSKMDEGQIRPQRHRHQRGRL